MSYYRWKIFLKGRSDFLQHSHQRGMLRQQVAADSHSMDHLIFLKNRVLKFVSALKGSNIDLKDERLVHRALSKINIPSKLFALISWLGQKIHLVFLSNKFHSDYNSLLVMFHRLFDLLFYSFSVVFWTMKIEDFLFRMEFATSHYFMRFSLLQNVSESLNASWRSSFMLSKNDINLAWINYVHMW